MRYRFLLLIPFLCAFSPVYQAHDNQQKTDGEFVNLYDQAQAEQFRVVTSTPILSDLKDSEVVIFSSGTSKLMWRAGQEVYAVQGSCVTVRR